MPPSSKPTPPAPEDRSAAILAMHFSRCKLCWRTVKQGETIVEMRQFGWVHAECSEDNALIAEALEKKPDAEDVLEEARKGFSEIIKLTRVDSDGDLSGVQEVAIQHHAELNRFFKRRTGRPAGREAE